MKKPIEKQIYQRIIDGTLWICCEIYYKQGLNGSSIPEEQRVIMKNDNDRLQVNLENFWSEFCSSPACLEVNELQKDLI